MTDYIGDDLDTIITGGNGDGVSDFNIMLGNVGNLQAADAMTQRPDRPHPAIRRYIDIDYPVLDGNRGAHMVRIGSRGTEGDDSLNGPPERPDLWPGGNDVPGGGSGN